MQPSHITRREVLHIDVNSAFLSWEAAYRLQHGDTTDIRNLAAVIGGNPKTRRGIVLAKSTLAKNAGIQTGESLHAAFQKCPNLVVIPPNYALYVKSSRAMVDLLKIYSPMVQRFSIDECFLELTNVSCTKGDAVSVAHRILNDVKDTLGFTVSIGVSSNKLLAKVASDFKKPHAVSTLYPEEMAKKFWPMPVSDMFMVGRATKKKLERIGLFTVGDLAKADVNMLKHHFGKFGFLIWQYANGSEDACVLEEEKDTMKGIGNSTTIPYDVERREDAALYILSLTEMVSMRLRDAGKVCGLVSVSFRTSEFEQYSHQKKLDYMTDSTEYIYKEALALFDAGWKKEPLRHIGVRVSTLSDSAHEQLSLFAPRDLEKTKKLDQTMDELRKRFGNKTIMRGSFLNSGVKPMSGGIAEEDTPTMTSTL